MKSGDLHDREVEVPEVILIFSKIEEMGPVVNLLDVGNRVGVVHLATVWNKVEAVAYISSQIPPPF